MKDLVLGSSDQSPVAAPPVIIGFLFFKSLQISSSNERVGGEGPHRIEVNFDHDVVCIEV